MLKENIAFRSFWRRFNSLYFFAQTNRALYLMLSIGFALGLPVRSVFAQEVQPSEAAAPTLEAELPSSGSAMAVKIETVGDDEAKKSPQIDGKRAVDFASFGEAFESQARFQDVLTNFCYDLEIFKLAKHVMTQHPGIASSVLSSGVFEKYCKSFFMTPQLRNRPFEAFDAISSFSSKATEGVIGHAAGVESFINAADWERERIGSNGRVRLGGKGGRGLRGAKTGELAQGVSPADAPFKSAKSTSVGQIDVLLSGHRLGEKNDSDQGGEFRQKPRRPQFTPMIGRGSGSILDGRIFVKAWYLAKLQISSSTIHIESVSECMSAKKSDGFLAVADRHPWGTPEVHTRSPSSNLPLDVSARVNRERLIAARHYLASLVRTVSLDERERLALLSWVDSLAFGRFAAVEPLAKEDNIECSSENQYDRWFAFYRDTAQTIKLRGHDVSLFSRSCDLSVLKKGEASLDLSNVVAPESLEPAEKIMKNGEEETGWKTGGLDEVKIRDSESSPENSTLSVVAAKAKGTVVKVFGSATTALGKIFEEDGDKDQLEGEGSDKLGASSNAVGTRGRIATLFSSWARGRYGFLEGTSIFDETAVTSSNYHGAKTLFLKDWSFTGFDECNKELSQLCFQPNLEINSEKIVNAAVDMLIRLVEMQSVLALEIAVQEIQSGYFRLDSKSPDFVCNKKDMKFSPKTLAAQRDASLASIGIDAKNLSELVMKSLKVEEIMNDSVVSTESEEMFIYAVKMRRALMNEAATRSRATNEK